MDSKPIKRQERGEQARHRLIETAVVEFSTKGFEGASLRRIAKAAGENYGQIAYYFGDKKALWSAVIAHYATRVSNLAGRAGAVAGSVANADGLRNGIRTFVRLLAEMPDFNRLMIYEAATNSSRSQWLRQNVIKPTFDVWLKAIGPSVQYFRVPTMEPVALLYAILGAGGMIFTQANEYKAVTGDDPFDPEFVERYADMIADLFVR